MAKAHTEVFTKAYTALNKEQKEAVDTTEGPVMVIAGPGTGKTQILALRIAHILDTSDIGPSGILCLTFTRSGVAAMKERLVRYIGQTGNDVHVSTFHSFAIELVEKYFSLLGFSVMPTLLDEKEAVFLVDELLHSKEWKHLRPRHDATQYFNDLRSLISLLKREGIQPEDFERDIAEEIRMLQTDPESVSSRGATKGELKKDIVKKIESLERTLEVVEFYRSYEDEKRALSLMDYDDVLEYAVSLVRDSEDVCAELRENFQYILVDEHQDSTGVQNNFLKAVWGDVEQPNIFVVGDDRQLIYGFGGAALNYFEDFKTSFGRAHVITLIENYRSTGGILSLADTLLSSSLTTEKLRSTTQDKGALSLVEYDFPRDEIIGCALYMKERIEKGTSPSECALLVPKNYHVRSAIALLKNYGIPVTSSDMESFFENERAFSFLKILRAVSKPNDPVSVGETLFDPLSSVGALSAHEFLRAVRSRDVSLSALLLQGKEEGMFRDSNSVFSWGKRLSSYVEASGKMNLMGLLSFIGNDLLVDGAQSHEELLGSAEVLRTIFHLAEMRLSTHPHETLSDFLVYLDRLASYGVHIPLATFSGHEGVSVMTLHRSKGLEFENVWIAHMNEESFMSSKRNAFTLPLSLKDKLEGEDIETKRRELYVAITRAKKNCTISYAARDYRGRDLSLARIIGELGEEHFFVKNKSETEAELLSHGEGIYTEAHPLPKGPDYETMLSLVKNDFSSTKVSVSLLNNFFECPWKWYFRNFLKLPEIKSDALSLGSAVHFAIEMILKDKKNATEKMIIQHIEESFLKEGVRDERTLSKLTRDATATVLEWVQDSYKDIAPKHDSEQSISFKDARFPELQLFGKVDLTENLSPQEVAVTDFKTGSSKTPGMIEKRDEEGRPSSFMRQLAMYSYLIEGSWKKDVVYSQLHFLEAKRGDKNKIYRTHIGQEEIDLLVRDIEDYRKALLSGEWAKRECHAEFVKGDECEYCTLAKKVYKKDS